MNLKIFINNKIFKFLNNLLFKIETGFTLIEIIVAIGVFSLVITAIAGASVSISKAQRKAVAIQDEQDNLRFALEFMSREIRTGTNFNQTNPVDKNDINFKNQSGENIIYQLSADKKILRSVDGGSLTDFVAGNISVENLKFYLSGSFVEDGIQTLITISMSLKSKNIFATVSDIQMSITPRAIDK